MENNQLKEKIRKNVKEKIAISNIRKEFDMKGTNKDKKKILNIVAVFFVVVLVGTLSTRIYAKISWDIKFKEYQNREYINGTGTVKDAFESGYGENIDMEYIEQDGIKVKVDSLIVTDNYFASNINFKFPEGTQLNSETFHFGYAVYDENNNMYVISPRMRYNNPPKVETYWRYLYKEIGKDTPYIDLLCDGSGITNIKAEGNNIISEIKVLSSMGFPKSKKLYIRVFDLGYYMADIQKDYKETTFEDFTVSKAEWIFEIDVPEKFYTRQVQELKLSEDIPKVESIELYANEVDTIIKITSNELVELIGPGMNGNELKESIYITDEEDIVYYDNTMGGIREGSKIRMTYPISKEMLNKKFFLNIKIDEELYTREILKVE